MHFDSSPWRVCAVFAPVAIFCLLALRSASAGLQSRFDEGGLASLTYDGTELLQDAALKVREVMMRRANGETYKADIAGVESRKDARSRAVTCDYGWGTVACAYGARKGRFCFDITVNNRSPDTLAKISLEPIRFKIPRGAAKFDLDIRKGHNWGSPTVIGLDYGSGVMAVVNEDVTRPLYVGFPKDASEPLSLMLSTAKEDGWPRKWMDDPIISRPIPPGASDAFHLSLRFGEAVTPVAKLAGDIYRRYAAAHPLRLHWNDRRPIGALFLSTSHPTIEEDWPKNPRGWFQDGNADFTGEAGRARFKERLLAYAASSIAILKEMNAQGAIVWDSEGQEYPHATSYIGDPRRLSPEMEPVADEFFRRFTDAGLGVGVCVRPQLSAHERLGFQEGRRGAAGLPDHA